MKHKLQKVTKQTNNKYLNLYALTYDDKINYYIASRRAEHELAIVKQEDKTDAVRVVPYFYQDDKLKVVVIKEFRYPVNRYIYQLPAGLVDDGETEEEAVRREIKEELGADIVSITLSEKAGYVSAGMTDEKIAHFWANVKLGNEPELGEGEDISVEIIDFEDIINFVENNEIALVSKMQLKAFYYEVMYKRNI